MNHSKQKISISWSGGKDCAYMLGLIKDDYDIVELHTTINSETQRVGLHGVHKDLIEAQAISLGIAIHFISVDPSQSNDAYEKATNEYYQSLMDRGIKLVGFGDIFLEDLKAYRDNILRSIGLTGVYPLWKQDTHDLSHKFVNAGFKSVICASDAFKFSPPAAGKFFHQLLANGFPNNIDPCGENGEFHSYVFDGPIFNYPIDIKTGELIEKAYHYTDDKGNQKRSSFHFCPLYFKEKD